MITDTLDRLGAYYCLGGSLGRALEFLASRPLDALPEGRTDIDGDDAFLLVQSRETRPSSEEPFETHRKYADIHITLEGEEWMGYAPEADLEPLSGYSSEKDCRTYSGDGVFFRGGPDRFFLFFPWDGHKGCITMGAGGRVRKIVVKAALEGR